MTDFFHVYNQSYDYEYYPNAMLNPCRSSFMKVHGSNQCILLAFPNPKSAKIFHTNIHRIIFQGMDNIWYLNV